jgi:hypothetical protein
VFSFACPVAELFEALANEVGLLFRGQILRYRLRLIRFQREDGGAFG